jgi:hypothetical protein
MLLVLSRERDEPDMVSFPTSQSLGKPRFISLALSTQTKLLALFLAPVPISTPKTAYVSLTDWASKPLLTVAVS